MTEPARTPIGDDITLLLDAVTFVVADHHGSLSFVQRKVRVGFAVASRLLTLMEERGIVGPAIGSRVRDVLVKPADLPRVLERLKDEAVGRPVYDHEAYKAAAGPNPFTPDLTSSVAQADASAAAYAAEGDQVAADRYAETAALARRTQSAINASTAGPVGPLPPCAVDATHGPADWDLDGVTCCTPCMAATIEQNGRYGELVHLPSLPAFGGKAARLAARLQDTGEAAPLFGEPCRECDHGRDVHRGRKGEGACGAHPCACLRFRAAEPSREAKFEPGWLPVQVAKSLALLDSLPPGLRDSLSVPLHHRPAVANLAAASHGLAVQSCGCCPPIPGIYMRPDHCWSCERCGACGVPPGGFLEAVRAAAAAHAEECPAAASPGAPEADREPPNGSAVLGFVKGDVAGVWHRMDSGTWNPDRRWWSTYYYSRTPFTWAEAVERGARWEHDLHTSPTQDAYDRACAALEKHRQRADVAEAALATRTEQARAMAGSSERFFGEIQRLKEEAAARDGEVRQFRADIEAACRALYEVAHVEGGADAYDECVHETGKPPRLVDCVQAAAESRETMRQLFAGWRENYDKKAAEVRQLRDQLARAATMCARPSGACMDKTGLL